ncbi:hypothetical protein OROGR_015050 [Orobanche gracilis]
MRFTTYDVCGDMSAQQQRDLLHFWTSIVWLPKIPKSISAELDLVVKSSAKNMERNNHKEGCSMHKNKFEQMAAGTSQNLVQCGYRQMDLRILTPLVIRKVLPAQDSDLSRLPSSQTCFCALSVSPYDSAETMRSKLRTVTENCDNFELL